MIFWHVATALLVVRYVFRDPRMDLRFVALGAVLPDLIDKPIGTVLFAETFRNSRIYGHTLLFPIVLMVTVMAVTRRGTRERRAWLGVPIGALLHLVVDGIWMEPVTFWWPMLGWEFPEVREDYWSDLVARLVTSPALLVQEVLGLAYLAYLWRKGGLGDPRRRREFLRSGRLEPVGRSDGVTDG